MPRLKDAFFLLGIGGMGMSAIAHYLLDRGDLVAGADRQPNGTRCRSLIGRGVELWPQGAGGLKRFVRGQLGRQVVVVRSAAVEDGTPEMNDAVSLGLTVIDRVGFLSDRFNHAPKRIAVVGSAGKTTTSALLAHILVESGKDPSYAVGALIGSRPNGRYGHGEMFVIEADESDGSVVRYTADVVLFTNLFEEHRTLHELRESFLALFARMPAHGTILYAAMDDTLSRMTDRAMIAARGTVNHCSAGETLVVTCGDRKTRIALAGAHNLPNVELAIAGAVHLGIPIRDALRALESFPGVEHRMAVVGHRDGVVVYTDFAHSPDEIHASYGSARSLGSRVIYVYQPHGYRPTHQQKAGLVEVFSNMREGDAVVLTEIYYAGGTVSRQVTGEELYRSAIDRHTNTFFVPDLAALPDVLSRIVRRGDVVVLAGARSITEMGTTVLAALPQAPI